MNEVGFCGYNLTEINNFIVRRDGGSSDYLFVLLMTPFYVHSKDGEVQVAEPMACMLFAPGEYQYYEAIDKFKNSFIHFTPNYDFLSEYNIPTSTIFYPKRPELINQILKNIVIEATSKPIHYKQKIDCLVNELIIDFSREVHNITHSTHDESLFLQFHKIRLSMVTHCETEWTTDSVCKLAHMEKSQFYSYYSRFFNTTPKADIINARIEKAKNLLTNQELKVNQVSEICGFKNVSHFTRCFKKHVKCTPGEYAKNASPNMA
ncbi:MAG: helix-turn-helix transcriptional regulator [Defluviitaleaceae bacterium]|nr:helix-turn-helix transcriptional regulator [Defluviitaleaceae bacterium]